MCFSTVASFGAGALLTGAGVVAARSVDKPAAQWAFAAIPVLFAVQQFTEGFVWLSLSRESFATWKEPATYGFMFFAQGVWPAWMPLAIWKIEKDRWRRQILFTLFGLGIALSVHMLYCLIAFPVDSRIIGHHIQYDLASPRAWMTYSGIVYGVVTIVPAFVSTISRMWMLGLATLGSLMVSKVFFHVFFISVWCFFAALISLLVIYYLLEMRKATT